MGFLKVVSAAILLLSATLARANLIPYTSNDELLVYSNEQALTFVQDANLFKTQYDNYSGAFPSLVHEIIAVAGTIEGKEIIQEDFNPGSGTMRWYGAMAWIAWLNAIEYAGANDWRLWEADPECGGRPSDPDPHDCPDGELGFLYYVEGELQLGDGLSADPPGILASCFSNLRTTYWAANNDGTYGWARWVFSASGRQVAYNYNDYNIPNFFFGWAVRDGQLSSDSSIFEDRFEDWCR